MSQTLPRKNLTYSVTNYEFPQQHKSTKTLRLGFSNVTYKTNKPLVAQILRVINSQLTDDNFLASKTATSTVSLTQIVNKRVESTNMQPVNRFLETTQSTHVNSNNVSNFSAP